MQDRKEKKSFFNWFYFAINFGSLLAVTVVVYIQDSISWAIGFAIPAAAMLLAILTFVGGSSKYKHVEPTERSDCLLLSPKYFCFRSRRCSRAILACTHQNDRHRFALFWRLIWIKQDASMKCGTMSDSKSPSNGEFLESLSKSSLNLLKLFDPSDGLSAVPWPEL